MCIKKLGNGTDSHDSYASASPAHSVVAQALVGTGQKRPDSSAQSAWLQIAVTTMALDRLDSSLAISNIERDLSLRDG